MATSRPTPVLATKPVSNVPADSSPLTQSSLVLYHDFEDVVAAKDRTSHFVNRVGSREASDAESCTLTDGLFGRAVAMNGANSNVATKVPWKRAATVAFWVRVRDASQPYYLLEDGPGAGAFAVQRWADAPQDFMFSVYSRGQWPNRTISHRLTENKWHHVAVVLNQSADVVRYFADGLLAGKVELPLRAGTWDGYVMISTPWGEKALPGDVDDLAIFDQMLNQSHVNNIYQSGRQGINLAELLRLSADAREDSLSSNANREAAPKKGNIQLPSLIMQMPFDGGNGVVLPERSWTGNTTEYSRRHIASVQDIRLVKGYRDNGLSFNGRSSVVCTNVPMADVRSVAFWLRVRSFGEGFRLLSSHNGHGAAFGILCGIVEGDNRQRFALGLGGPTQWKYATFDHRLTEGQWHHLIFSFDWTRGTLIYAVDGRAVEPIKFDPPAQPFTGKLTISNDYEGAALNGDIDDLQVSSAILTPDEIRAIWQNPQQ